MSLTVGQWSNLRFVTYIIIIFGFLTSEWLSFSQATPKKTWDDRPLPENWKPIENPPQVRDMCDPAEYLLKFPNVDPKDRMDTLISSCESQLAYAHMIRNIGGPFWRGRFNFIINGIFWSTPWNYKMHYANRDFPDPALGLNELAGGDFVGVKLDLKSKFF